MAEPAFEKISLTPLLRSRLHPGDSFRRVLVAVVPYGTTEEQLMNPAFWSMVASQLSINDRIEVYCEAGSYFAELMVRGVGVNSVSVQMLRIHVLTEPQMEQREAPLFVRYGGAHSQWQVVRKSDKSVVREHLPTQDVAEREMKDLMKAYLR